MNYYRAYEQDTLPLLVFELVATSLQELEDLELDTDPYVVEEPRLLDPGDPNYISYEFGICHYRIHSELLQPRLQADIDEAEANFLVAERVEGTKKNITSFKSRIFTYDGHEFPMNEGAAIAYDAIFNTTPIDRNIMSLSGDYLLTIANIDAFKNEYYSTVIEVYNENSTLAEPS